MKRLFEDPHMPAELRDDLRRSRVAASDYDASAGLASLRAALVDPTRDPLRGPSLERAGAGKAGWSWRATPTAWKLAVLVTIGGGAALLTWPAWHAGTSPPSAAVGVAPAAHAPPPASAPPVPPALDAPEPIQAAAEPASPQPPAAPDAAPVVSTSRREISQLVRIRALLQRDPAAAYRLARRSEREFPHGLLSEERQALTIVALAQSGGLSAAAQQATAFFARYPRSPLRELVESALRR